MTKFEDKLSTDRIFSEGVPGVFFFYKDLEVEEFRAFVQVADYFKGKMVFVSSHKNDHREFESYLGISEYPSIVVAMVTGDRLEKFYFDGDIEKDELQEFLEKFMEGDVKKIYKSAEPPRDNKAAVKVVVGDTFSEIVLDIKKDVILVLYNSAKSSRRFLEVFLIF